MAPRFSLVWPEVLQPLIVKNPAHTGRIKLILDMFPEAKFIYIQRHPYHTYLSICHLYSILLRYFRLQDIQERQMKAHILLFYEGILKRYLKERSLIPEGNLVEVRFEDMERDPFTLLQHI
jgi:hypothetical protein